MAREQNKGKRIKELHKAISLSQKYRQEIKDNLNTLEQKRTQEEITQENYKKELNKKAKGKTREQWIDNYNTIIENAKTELQKIETTQPTPPSHTATATMLTVLVLIMGLGLLQNNITGFVTFGEQNNYLDEIGLKFEENTVYTWQPENTGEIQNIKLTGTVEGKGTAKVYIERNGKKILILDSNKITKKIEGITGAVTANKKNNPPKQTSKIPNINIGVD